MFKRLVLAYHRARMTDLGRELEEAMEKDEWRIGEHRVEHVASGIDLWIGNGFKHFKMHSVVPLRMREHDVEKMLNLHDRKVLWEAVQWMRIRAKQAPKDAVLNLLRLKRQQGENK